MRQRLSRPQARTLPGVLFYGVGCLNLLAHKKIADCDPLATKPWALFYWPNKPKNSSISYFNVSYHTNAFDLCLRCICPRDNLIWKSKPCDKNITLQIN